VLAGAIPGAFLGAQLSSRAPGGIIRRALAIVLMASGLKLVGAPTPVVVAAALGAIAGGNVAWILLRRRFSASRPVPSFRRGDGSDHTLFSDDANTK
jgi:hypothetical protein